MSSADLQSALTTLQQNDYLSLAILTAVVYDYVLTFSEEIEYIWGKPWSRVSTLYILARYCGLCLLVITSLNGSTFIPGPEKTYVSALPSFLGLCNIIDIYQNSCEIIFFIQGWLFVVFVGAADFVMVLRVWAMYNRSRVILTTLLLLFSLEIISATLTAGSESNPKNITVSVVQILNLSFCEVLPNSPIWTQVAASIQIVYGAVICMLAVVQFMKQSLQMYRAVRRWQPNRYMNLLIRQGIIYFFAVFLFNITDLLAISGKLPSEGWQFILICIVEYVPIFTLTPRFIMSTRKLYARDVRAGYGSGIDTAFGLSSFSRGGARSALMFADVGQNEGSSSRVVEDIPMDATQIGTTVSN